jgi:hypothetical protein
MRIVLEHTSGILKGIHSICGLAKDAPSPLPEFNPEVDMRDHTAPVSLVVVKRSYVLYREVTTPEMQNGKSFNKGQR